MVKRAPLAETEKQYLMQRKRAGATLQEIAGELNCSLATVRKWWRYGRDSYRPRPRGRPALGVLSSYPAELGEQAVALKRCHPHWGPANVKLELQEQLGVAAADLPSDARLAALFKLRCPEAVQPRRRTHYAEKPVSTASYPHQRWQADAQEKIRLTGGELVTILNVSGPAAIRSLIQSPCARPPPTTGTLGCGVVREKALGGAALFPVWARMTPTAPRETAFTTAVLRVPELLL